MRILYLDLDTLRPDHLGCYGYHRDTSPNLDRIASEGVRFDRCYVPNAPCLPSRSALFTGQFGIHNNVINHGGTNADPVAEGPSRAFRQRLDRTGWIPCLRRQGMYPVWVSSFAERHSAFQTTVGYREIFNPGKGGLESAEEVTPYALNWIRSNAAQRDNWFLHVNYWDAHTPYRAPEDFGNPFADSPAPEWHTEQVRQANWDSYGPHSAHEVTHFDDSPNNWPRHVCRIDSMEAWKRWIDGYDCGIRYMDSHIGMLLDALEEAGVLDDLVIMVSSDHGENQGELNVYGDHQTADLITSRVPLLVRWPGITQPRVDTGFHYQGDWAATMVELLGGEVPACWDVSSFASAFRANQETGRDYLVVEQAAWSCQRTVLWDNWCLINTYHDGLKNFPPVMLFNAAEDPHETNNLAAERPEVVSQGLARLAEWQGQMMLTSRSGIDPLFQVISEGGPLHTRGQLGRYCERLRATGRGHHADALEARHGKGK